jgi:hypothetical protein
MVTNLITAFIPVYRHPALSQHFHARLALLNRLSGFLAASGNILACPADLAQNDFRLAASAGVFGFGAGGFSPGLPGLALLYEARPLAFKPPLGFLPSDLVHAGDLGFVAIMPTLARVVEG